MNAPEVELYAIPFSCSLAAHIALREAQAPHRLRWVTRGSLRLEDGSDFRAVNPKAKVPALRRADGRLVTENAAVLLTIAGDTRVETVEGLTYIATELHKQVLFPSFDPAAPEATKQDVLKRLLPPVLSHLAAELGQRPFLVGESFSVADAYLLWALMLVAHLEVTLDGPLVEYSKRLRARPAVKEALRIEREKLNETEAAP